MNQNLTIFSIKNSRWIAAWMRKFCNATTMKSANMTKCKGAGTSLIMHMLLSLPFTSLQVWQMSGQNDQRPCRDTFYRFLSQTRYNWRRLLWRVSQTMITELNRLTGPRTDRVLVIDDSPYKRDRSKAVEYLGRQYDHSSGRFYRGFRLLAAGWSDGHSFVPVAMELLTNADRDKRIGPDPQIDRRTNAGKRSRAACRKAPELTRQMIDQCQHDGLPVDYIVFDSWYATPGLLKQASERFAVVCMLKKHPNQLYRHGKRLYTLTELYQKVLRRATSRKDGPVIGSIRVAMLNGPAVRVVFVRDERDPDKWPRKNRGTDLDISNERICRIYAKRWAIEVFFKQIKQHLGLFGEMQLRSYTSCVAFTTIVFLRYMMLCYYQRQQADQRTIPGLFYAGCQQMQAVSIQACLQVILLEVLVRLSRCANHQAFQAACAICGIVEHFTKKFHDNALTLKPLTLNCES